MKVLQLGKFYPIRGGVEKVMWDLTRGLGERGVVCDMLCAYLPGDHIDHKDELFYDAAGRDSYCEDSVILRLNPCSRVVCVPAKKKLAGTMICPEMIKTLKKMLREAEKEGGPYDVVHVHHPDPMAALALFCSGFRGRVVLHWHSDILKQRGLLKLFLPLQSWLIRRADKVVGTTPVYVAESPYLKHVQKKVSYIPIGIEPMTPSEKGVSHIRAHFEGKKLAFSLGRLVSYKGYGYLIEAAQYLPDDYVVVIGGQGPMMEELQDRIDELGLDKKVRLLGWVQDVDSADWYGAADVFVLPSIMKTEAFAIVQIEAMSCGTPVVATRIPGSGVSWVNRQGVSGLNVPIMDSKALAEAIVKVCDSKDTFGPAAKVYFDENFTYKSMIDRCVDLYASLF